MSDQVILSATQTSAFDHLDFVSEQVRDFRTLVPGASGVVDIGGGVGAFASEVGARVIDLDEHAVDRCRALALDARVGDALHPPKEAGDRIACFNLVLHHLVGRSERQTRALQIRALQTWHGAIETVFVNEYIYESFIPGMSGRLIYEITSSRLLSALARIVGRYVPALRANTLGVGVRFRDDHEWKRLFGEAGYKVVSQTHGWSERIDLPLRMLLIRGIRRNSYRLELA